MKTLSRIVLATSLVLASSSSFAELGVGEIGSAAKNEGGTAAQRIVLYSTTKKGSETYRDGGDRPVTVQMEGDQCVKTTVKPAFMNSQKSVTSKQVLDDSNCRSYRVAAEIQRQLGKCEEQGTSLKTVRDDKNMNSERIYIKLSENCSCRYVKETETFFSTAASLTTAPLNHFFNGPEYIDTYESSVATADECLPLFKNSRDQEVARQAYKTVK